MQAQVSTPIYIFYKDLNSRYLGCNLDLAKLAGLSSESELIGKTDYDLIWGEEFGHLYQQSDQEVLEGVFTQNKIEPLLRSDGKTTSILINKIPMVDPHGQKIGVMGSYIEKIDFTQAESPDLSKSNIALSKKQAEYLYYLAQGMSAKQIADIIGISTRTSEYYIRTLKSKFNLYSKSCLIAKALTLPYIRQKLLVEPYYTQL